MPDATVAAYAYDVALHSAPPTEVATERGPPAVYDPSTGYDAEGQLLGGASPRPNEGTTFPAYAYDDPARSVHIARRSGDAEEQVGRAEPGSAEAQRSEVAAKAGPSAQQIIQSTARTEAGRGVGTAPGLVDTRG
ncbi:hypothetical protein EON82_24060 [bacterium]|nr:MAG: hypothetical protein EON82_24060 [bacterium]